MSDKGNYRNYLKHFQEILPVTKDRIPVICICELSQLSRMEFYASLELQEKDMLQSGGLMILKYGSAKIQKMQPDISSEGFAKLCKEMLSAINYE